MQCIFCVLSFLNGVDILSLKEINAMCRYAHDVLVLGLDLISDFYLTSLQLVLCRVAAVKRLLVHQP